MQGFGTKNAEKMPVGGRKLPNRGRSEEENIPLRSNALWGLRKYIVPLVGLWALCMALPCSAVSDPAPFPILSGAIPGEYLSAPDGLPADTLNDSRPKAARKREGGEAAETVSDSLQRQNDRNARRMVQPVEGDSLLKNSPLSEKRLDSLAKTIQPRKQFIPDSKKATWLAAIFPGAGQIYNRKFWKLPIIYGGFLGCAYALSWNSKYYSDYSQAYLDIMDDDPKTQTYLDFLPINYQIEGREEWLKKVFKNKKNTFRRQRDLSIFAFIGVYIVSIIDAYVDAELSSFDITPDISLDIGPGVSTDRRSNNHSVGFQCNLRF